jgi:uncharacterized membrane protein
METAIFTSLISGFFALATALGSVWLKHHLEYSVKNRPSVTTDSAAKPAIETVSYGRPATRSGSVTFLRPLLVLLVAFAVGAMFRHFKTHDFQETVAVISFYVFIALSFVGLTVFHRRSPSGFWPFQLDSLTLWLAFTSGFWFVAGHASDDLLVGVLMFWLGFAIIGGSVVRFIRRNA